MNWNQQLRPVAYLIALTVAACSGEDSESTDNTARDLPMDDGTTDSNSEDEVTGDVAEDKDSSDPEVGAVGNIVEVAKAAGDFDTLLAAAEAADLVGALSGEGPLTVFAPTDAAFAALPEGALEALLADPEELVAVLSYHVVADNIASSAISDGDEVDTLLGPWLNVDVSGGEVMIGGARVLMTDIEASNGTIHVIEEVLLPPPSIAELAAQTEDVSTLVAALEAADLVETLNGEGPFTVFAPTNAAFEALPEGTLESLLDDPQALSDVLLYHVVSGRRRASTVLSVDSLSTLQGDEAPIEVAGDSATIAGAGIAMTDIQARNGVIHLLDAVMLPPAKPTMDVDDDVSAEDTLDPDIDQDGEDVDDSSPGNIAEVAAEAGTFTTLLAAAEAAGLVDTLTGEGPLTIFAPTDAAFEALPEGAVEALLEDTDELAAVLSYHVIPGEVLAGSIDDGARADTVLGPWLQFTVDDSGVSLGDTRVTNADIRASNGVIHVIDQVLLPPPPITTIAAQTPELSTLVTALEAAGLTETLQGKGPFTVFAPTNSAFEALPEGTVEGLLDDPEALSSLLLFHVVGSRQSAASVLESSEFMTLSGEAATITKLDEVIAISGAPVGVTDIVARNGIIHLLDAVMLPSGE